MKIIFMGTPEFAVPALRKLIESGHEIPAVYTRAPAPAGRGKSLKKSPVHELAEAHKIPIRTYASLKGEAEQREFVEFGGDLALVAAYGLLLPEPILNAPKYGCINIHPSLLPRWRGAAPIQRTIMAGDSETGVCIMRMDRGLDTGDILMMEKYSVSAKITAGELHDKLAEIGAELALQTIRKLPDIKPLQQQGEAVYAKKILRDEEKIDWRKPAAEIECLIRGLQPRPGAYFEYKGERIKIIEACHSREGGNLSPGTILDENLTIACGSGTLKPLKLQRPGKNITGVNDFLRGFMVKPGEVLE